MYTPFAKDAAALFLAEYNYVPCTWCLDAGYDCPAFVRISVGAMQYDLCRTCRYSITIADACIEAFVIDGISLVK